MNTAPGPQCTVCGREYPASLPTSSASSTFVTAGALGSGSVSRMCTRDERMPGTTR